MRSVQVGDEKVPEVEAFRRLRRAAFGEDAKLLLQQMGDHMDSQAPLL